MRYFGPTSGRLQFQSSATADTAIHLSGQARSEYDSGGLHSFDGITAGLGISKTLQELLISLYFRWEQPWFAVVDEELFRQSLHHGGRYWSPLLHLCILAVGSRYSESTQVRSKLDDSNTAGMIFLEQAKYYLQAEVEKPSLTTIQALAIIGMFYIAIGADATGWLYHGMANRLVLDMGLNLDPAGFEETRLLSHREIQLRRQIYWTLYCHDKWSSSYTGRICSMLDSQGAVKVPEDDVDAAFDVEGTLRKTLPKLQRAMISLCRIQERMILSLWAPKPLLKDSQRSPFLKSTMLELKSWFYDLPAELRIDRPNDLPHAYTLHMMYHTARILLAKPFIMSSSKKSPNPSSREGSCETTRLALSISRESAREICTVAQKYRDVFGGFQLSPISATHCTLSACLVILDDETENLATASHKRKLSLCLTVLDELARSWHPAQHIGRNLRKLCLSATLDELLFAPEASTGSEHGEGLEVPHELGGDLIDVVNMDPPSMLATHWDLSAPVETLPLDYGFFDILNQDALDRTWEHYV
ncbi:fungal-specific transcription factor domain-containing protein [Aspergillus pseudoustus]|uniref:Fungal-specific transcription factor domain-containing protein n=1 Tax=Aspergillus pseudoustus TaxID=1810923 RepID=A0ABR4J3C0_9EURO